MKNIEDICAGPYDARVGPARGTHGVLRIIRPNHKRTVVSNRTGPVRPRNRTGDKNRTGPVVGCDCMRHNISHRWVHLMIICLAPRHYPQPMPMPVRPESEIVNTLRPRQNGRHFADGTFNRIFVNEKVWIPIKISRKFVPKGPINNIPALDQIMAWRRPGDKPLSEPMMVSLTTHICVTRPQWVKWQWNLQQNTRGYLKISNAPSA